MKTDSKRKGGKVLTSQKIYVKIGIPNEKYRIYIEDYVYTFLKKIAEKAEEEEKGAAAVFTGEIKWNSGYRLSVYQGSSDGRGRGDFGRACRVQ